MLEYQLVSDVNDMSPSTEIHREHDTGYRNISVVSA